MPFRRTLFALPVAIAATLPVGAKAATLGDTWLDDSIYHQAGFDTLVLHAQPNRNRDLQEGNYVFAGMHGAFAGFFDEWKFTLAEDAKVSITLRDLELSFNDLPGVDSDRLLDNKYLTFSLFDRNDHLLGSAGADGTLSALNLLAGEWYTVTVSGRAAGLFGGFYYGNLGIESVHAVPIGDSLPLFGCALLALAVRARKQVSQMRKSN